MDKETLKSLDIVYECDEVLGTTYLYGQPTEDEILDHVTRLVGCEPFEIQTIVK